MPNKELGIADPVYDALRIRSGQSIAPDLGGGSTGGTGLENKIYVWYADGSTIDLFDPDATGLGLALAAAGSGDMVICPRPVQIALTAGITIPAGVRLRDANLAFSGFSGTGVTLSDDSIFERFFVSYDATGFTDAIGISTAGAAIAVLWYGDCAVSGGSGTNTGIYLAGAGPTGSYIHTFQVYGQASGGTTAIGVHIVDFVRAVQTNGASENASGLNAGCLFSSTSDTLELGSFLQYGYLAAPGAAGAGIEIEAACYGRIYFALGWSAAGDGLKINTGATALIYGVAYSSLNNLGTLTELDGIPGTGSGSTLPAYARGNIIRGGATDWESYDANDAGFIVQGDGTDVKSAAFDWDVFAAGSGADMVHSHADNTEGGVIPGVDIASDSANIAAVNFLEDGKPSAPAANHRIIYAKSTGIYAEDSAANEIGPLIGPQALNDLTDVDTTGTGTGDVIYNNAGTWQDYPLGVGSKITVSGTKIRFGNVAGGNYLEIDSVTGTLRLAGDATTYDDFRVEASVIKPGATAPNWKAFGPSGNLQALMFEASHHDEAYFELQMPHTWKLGTNLYPHVHWTPVNATAGNVVWELEYAWANIGDAYGAPGNMATDATAAGGVAWVHKLTDFKEGGNSYISGAGKTLSSMLICRLHRNSNAGSDTLNQDVALLEVDFHYQIDSLGSDEPLVKDASASLLLESGDILLLESGDRLLLE